VNAGLLEDEVLMEKLCGVVLEAAALWIYMVLFASDLGVTHESDGFPKDIVASRSHLHHGDYCLNAQIWPLEFRRFSEL